MDLSSPKGASINDFIDPSFCSLTYASVEDAAAYVFKAGQGALLAKLDIKSAYRNIPVYPGDRHLHATTPSTFRRWAWSRVQKYELACMSREAPRFLALELSFSTTAAYSFVFAGWGAIKVASLYENYLLVLSTATKMA